MILIKQSFNKLSQFGNASLEQLFLNQSVAQPDRVWFDPIDPDEDSFLNLLFYGGYLTSASTTTENHTTKVIYKIPNKEILLFFYTYLLPKWIKWSTSPEIKVKMLVSDLCRSIENKELYKETIQNSILKYLDHRSKTEADFQAMLVGCAIYARSLGISNHKAHSEVCTQEKTKINTLFLPIKNKSETIIIHEYKKIENSNLKEQALDHALWHIYINNYISKALQEIKGFLQFTKFIIVRAIVFFKGNGGWNVEIVELRHTIEEAARLCNIFQSEIQNDEITRRALLDQKEQRSRLLCSFSKDAKNIYEYLSNLSSSQREEERKEERKSENEASESSSVEVKKRWSARLEKLKNQKGEKRKLSSGNCKKTLRK